MASSQLQCLDEENVNLPVSESFPQFVYSEGQRQALEALLAAGPGAYTRCLERERLRPFLSAPEAQILHAGARPYCPSREPGPKGEWGPEETRSPSPPPPSSTYWPSRSDVAPPYLALGWPEGGLWKGITRAAVYTHPPAEGGPTIKEVVRRLLQNAKQVIAIVMDQFSDVDIFLDLVDTARLRKVAVYVLLDRQNLPLFLAVAQVTNTNLWLMENMRVRCLVGCSFCSRDGLKVEGAVKERFLLVDGEKVVTGSYSFTWCDARLHRQLAILLTGQVVDAFDQEFRTLYAASVPLPRDAASVPLPRDAASVPLPRDAPPILLLPPLPPLPNGFPGTPSPHRVSAHRTVEPPPPAQPLGGLAPAPRRRTPLPLTTRTGWAVGESSPAVSDVLRDLRRARDGLKGSRSHWDLSGAIRDGPKGSRSLWDIRAPGVDGPRGSRSLWDISAPGVDGPKGSRSLWDIRAPGVDGPKGSRSLWDLSTVSQRSGASGFTSTSSLELGEDARTRLMKTPPTPAAALMRHRRGHREDEELHPLPREPKDLYPSRKPDAGRGRGRDESAGR